MKKSLVPWCAACAALVSSSASAGYIVDMEGKDVVGFYGRSIELGDPMKITFLGGVAGQLYDVRLVMDTTDMWLLPESDLEGLHLWSAGDFFQGGQVVGVSGRLPGGSFTLNLAGQGFQNGKFSGYLEALRASPNLVPEPSTYGMMALGLLGLALCRKKR